MKEKDYEDKNWEAKKAALTGAVANKEMPYPWRVYEIDRYAEETDGQLFVPCASCVKRGRDPPEAAEVPDDAFIVNSAGSDSHTKGKLYLVSPRDARCRVCLDELVERDL